ncbi:hypothetical protein MYRNA_21 [Mycobacterium phage Myrna]|uniref:Uncharacterized protein n=1 Tax=Mycobacterium phage Myrna TaxID=546805 RepID=B5LJ32_9CAUD|nr:gp21 [Mycobacterium phage Myrna]ACH62029.1 hypothetical protein MYRNA_21 [Mycobacterium phage Myrna]
MSAGPDPYQETCDYTEEAQQFGESFECSRPAGHSGSHYDQFINAWAPNR